MIEGLPSGTRDQKRGHSVGNRFADVKAKAFPDSRPRELTFHGLRSTFITAMGEAGVPRARLRVAAGEAGVSGQSFEAQLRDSFLQEDQDVTTIGKDAKFQDRASEARFLSVNASVRNPSLLENGLTVAAAGARGFSLGRSLEIPTSPTNAIDPAMAISTTTPHVSSKRFA